MVDYRRVYLTCVASSLLVAGIGSPADAQTFVAESGPHAVQGPVRVVEADTLEVHLNGHRVGVAIAGIVVPPPNTPCGREAAAAAQALAADGVELHEDLAISPFDRRSLRVYRVFDRAGRSLAVELARSGYALSDENTPGALDRQLILAAAAEASVNAAGCISRQHEPQ
jgi:endonuclease YncB( thermonuclease family)